MKTPIEWYRELYQKGSGATVLEIAAIQADALEDLRDRFACAALTGILASLADEGGRGLFQVQAANNHLSPYNYAAALAYTLADAMMARRATQPTTGAPAPTTKGQ